MYEKSVREVATDCSKILLLSDLSKGDQSWEELVVFKSMDPDEPVILPAWNLEPCEEFYNKAVAYGERGGVVLPPAPIFDGAHPIGASTPRALQQMQLDFLTYLAATIAPPGASVIGGANGAVGLACSLLQFGNALALLGKMEHKDWFHAVLDHGAPLSGPLATWYIPRPSVSSGLCDRP